MMKLRVRHAAIALALLAPACAEETKETPSAGIPGASGEPEGLVVTPGKLPAPSAPAAAPTGPGPSAGGVVTLPNGGNVHTLVIDGKPYVPIEATFSERSWQSILGKVQGASRKDRDAAVKKELEAVFGKVSATARIVGADYVPSIGLATAYVPLDAYEGLASVQGIGRRLLVNPVVSTPMERAERDLKKDEDMGFAAQSAFSGLDDLVGLPRMGVTGFLAKAAADLQGYKPTGSHVLLGVVDTGITYNHPAFRDAEGHSRIHVIKDFTNEGRIIFSPNAKFEATKTEGGVKVTAEFIVSSTAVANPDPAAFQKVEGETLLLSPELQALLEAPNASGARLGILDETAYGSRGSGIDIDHNGKTNDRFFAILVPGHDDVPDAVWLAIGEKGDFRKSARLTDFNLNHETIPVWAERFGLHIKHEALLDAKGAEVPITSASIVGYDPGAHGSHVTGIAAARKIFANSPDDTNLRGVAPLAPIAFGRICANVGGCSGTKAIVDLSEGGARVINMSIGGLGPDNDGYGVQEAIIDRLSVQNGTVFVIAASNDGPGKQTVGSPSVARFSLSVAATASQKILQAQYQYPGSGKVPAQNPDAEDFLLYFSSRGPTAAGAMKPDISAPGTWLSAIQMNAPEPGAASGLDVMWGTSMASPAMAGAVTLLLDAAEVYNEQNPSAPLAVDARTVRKVLLASARPFDATTLDTATDVRTQGQYTWIDQGFGMVNLERAWELLKQERVARLTTPVAYKDENGAKHEVALDYQVRVLQKTPVGGAYDGSQSVAGAGDQPEAKFGRGLWIDNKVTTSNYNVQIARRLPSDVVDRADVGELAAQLLTTADEFELETTIHGSHLPWVRAGGLEGPDCAKPVASEGKPRLLVIGEGATDIPVDPTTGKGGSVSQSSSTLHVCVARSMVDLLPPGDHGAVITAYRVIGKKREAVPSFVVPVYITIPHKTLAGDAGLHLESSVGSFGVGRHYIDVPKNTSIVKVTVTVPKATQVGTDLKGCGGLILNALEGGNTLAPPEFAKNPGDAYAVSCTSGGQIAGDAWHSATIVRPAPRSGIWDLHVFGLYQYATTSYTLDVEFAKATTTIAKIEGAPAALATSFDLKVTDASYELKLDPNASTFTLNGFTHDRPSQAVQDETTTIPNAAGQIGRTYASDVAQVTIATGGSAGNDLDLEVSECEDEALTKCIRKGASAGPVDVETVSFVPVAGRFYVAAVAGYAVSANEGKYVLTETQNLATPEKGTLTMTTPSPRLFTFATALDPATSKVLNDPRFSEAGYAVHGRVDIKDDGGSLIVRIPVKTTR